MVTWFRIITWPLADRYRTFDKWRRCDNIENISVSKTILLWLRNFFWQGYDSRAGKQSLRKVKQLYKLNKNWILLENMFCQNITWHKSGWSIVAWREEICHFCSGSFRSEQCWFLLRVFLIYHLTYYMTFTLKLKCLKWQVNGILIGKTSIV